MKILVIDNYDSFTYNLVHIIKEHAADVSVIRNDKIEPTECLNYNAIILSPGPGIPEDAGNMPEIISTCAGKVPILGICLGHQALAEYLGAKLYNLPEVFHGVKSEIKLSAEQSPLFEGLEDNFEVGRYHSWAIDPKTLNDNISVTATEKDDCIMAIENQTEKLYGVQFHPESILTPKGSRILQNFLKMIPAV